MFLFKMNNSTLKIIMINNIYLPNKKSNNYFKKKVIYVYI